MPDKGFLLVTESADTVKYYAMILRYDSLGKVIMSKEIAKPFCTTIEWMKVTDIKSVENSQWLMMSRIACKPIGGSIQGDIVLTKLDSNFDVVWHKQIGDPGLDDAGWKLLIEPDGYLIAGGRNNISQAKKNFTLRAMLLKTDTTGAVQWTWLSDPSKKTFEARDVIRTKDGGYVYCGAGDGFEYLSANQTYSIRSFRGWVEKLDANRNVVWSKAFNKFYDPTEFKKVIEAPDGRLFLFGNKYLPDSLGNDIWDFHTKGWFLTLSATGDSLRERLYYNVSSCDDRNLIYDAEPTDDGGFIMVGEATDMCKGAIGPIQRAWIVKVDSNGCLGPNDPQCWPTAVPESPAKESISVRPNPVRDAWYVDNREGRKLDVTITDITGRVIYRKTSASSVISTDLSNYPDGLYLFRISTTEGILLQGKLLKE